jgi:transposase
MVSMMGILSGATRLLVDVRQTVPTPPEAPLTEGVLFARTGSRFTRDFEDLVGYLATTADKTTIGRLLRIDWDTVGRIITRVMGERLDPARLERLFCIGVDEVSWRKQARFLM